jgi:hypothetical protein
MVVVDLDLAHRHFVSFLFPGARRKCGISGVVVWQTVVNHVRRVYLIAVRTNQTTSQMVFEGRAEALIGEAHHKVFLLFRWKWTKQAKDVIKWTQKWIGKSG